MQTLRKQYHAPSVMEFGHIRTLTSSQKHLGASDCLSESLEDTTGFTCLEPDP